MDISAFILAGGRSSRMGRDKAGLLLDGQSLLQRAQSLAAAVTASVRIIGPRERFGPDAIEDVFPGAGPLAGIHAALSAGASEFNLILAVDTPFLTPEFLRFLVAEAERCATVVTVPFVGGRYQPLCAVYRRGFATLAAQALGSGRNKIDALFAHTTVRQIDEAELVRLAFDPRMFDNLNTPDEFARAQSRR